MTGAHPIVAAFAAFAAVGVIFAAVTGMFWLSFWLERRQSRKDAPQSRLP